MSELEYKLPVQAQSSNDRQVPHLMRTHHPRNENRPIQSQNDSTERISHTSPDQWFDEAKPVSHPEQDACDQSGPAEQQEYGNPGSGWKAFRENSPQRNTCCSG